MDKNIYTENKVKTNKPSLSIIQRFIYQFKDDA